MAGDWTELDAALRQADVDRATEAAFALLAAGAAPAELTLAAARAAAGRYAQEAYAPYGNHGLNAAGAALALEPYLHPDLQRLAAVWAAYHVALGLRGAPERQVQPAAPAAAAGPALVAAVEAGDPMAAAGALVSLLAAAPEPEIAHWYFTAAALDLGQGGHKLILAAHLWRLAGRVPAAERFALLRPGLHLAAATRLEDDAAEAAAMAGARRRAGGDPAAELGDLTLAVGRLMAQAAGDRFREGHLLSYVHAARLAWQASGGTAWLPVVQARRLVSQAARQAGPAERQAGQAGQAERGVAPGPAREVFLPELPVRAVFSGQVHALETVAAGLAEGEALPVAHRPELYGALHTFIAVQSGEAPPVIRRFKREYGAKG